MKFTVGISGHRGSGKSSLATQLANAYGFSKTSFGGVVRSEALRRGLEPTVESLQALGVRLIAEWDLLAFCDRVLAQAIPDTDVVIDGIRHAGVLQTLRVSAAPRRFVSVFVDVSEEDRRERLRLRDANDGVVRDTHAVEAQVASLRAVADLIVIGASATAADNVVRYLRSLEDSWRPAGIC